MSNQWTQEEIDMLHKNWDLRYEELHKLFPNRSKSSLYHKISRLGYKRDHKILREEDYQFIRDNIATMSFREMAKKLDVSRPVITRAIQNMNITKNVYWTHTSIEKVVEDSPFSIKVVYERITEIGED